LNFLPARTGLLTISISHAGTFLVLERKTRDVQVSDPFDRIQNSCGRHSCSKPEQGEIEHRRKPIISPQATLKETRIIWENLGSQIMLAPKHVESIWALL
jgi:hypothetical protein